MGSLSRTRLSDFTFIFHFRALEKEMATHSSILAWRIPGTVEPGGLPSMGWHRVGHDWSDLAVAVSKPKPEHGSVSLLRILFICVFHVLDLFSTSFLIIFCFHKTKCTPQILLTLDCLMTFLGKKSVFLRCWGHAVAWICQFSTSFSLLSIFTVKLFLFFSVYLLRDVSFISGKHWWWLLSRSC